MGKTKTPKGLNAHARATAAMPAHRATVRKDYTVERVTLPPDPDRDDTPDPPAPPPPRAALAVAKDRGPLLAYLARGKIEPLHYEAGEYIARVCHRAASAGVPVTSRFAGRINTSAPGTPGRPSPAEGGRATLVRVMVDAGIAEAGAGGALLFTREGDVVTRVCGLGEWAGGTRKLTLLRKGLERVASHLGFSG